jgi:glycerol-3-phosphate dehydrogenase
MRSSHLLLLPGEPRPGDCLQVDYDLIVVGGGIYGAWTALIAGLRGLRVALLERGEWASGTSCASSKLIHGGLRYLEHGDLGLVRKALRERSRLLRHAPHLSLIHI